MASGVEGRNRNQRVIKRGDRSYRLMGDIGMGSGRAGNYWVKGIIWRTGGGTGAEWSLSISY